MSAEGRKLLGWRVWRAESKDIRRYFDVTFGGSVVSFLWNGKGDFCSSRPAPMPEDRRDKAVVAAGQNAGTVHVVAVYAKAKPKRAKGGLWAFAERAIVAKTCRRIRGKLADALVVNNTVSHVLSEVEAGE